MVGGRLDSEAAWLGCKSPKLIGEHTDTDCEDPDEGVLNQVFKKMLSSTFPAPPHAIDFNTKVRKVISDDNDKKQQQAILARLWWGPPVKLLMHIGRFMRSPLR